MRPKVMWLSDINCTSGFGVVAEANLKYLQAKYEIVAAGWNFDPRKQYDKPWKYYYVHKEPNQARGLTMSMVLDGVYDVVQKEKPDVILCYADPWNFPYVSKEFIGADGSVYAGLRTVYPKAKIIGYLTADAVPLPTFLRNSLSCFDRIVVPSDFSKRAMQILMPNSPMDVVYHGIDPDIFKPLPKQTVDYFRNQLRITPNDFVIGFCGRNQFRKNIPALLRVFTRFHKLVPNSKLLMMTDLDAPNKVHEVKGLIDRLGVHDCVITPGKFGPKNEITDEQMNGYYNCMDVYMSLAYCEGFGIPILEAMATGKPVIHTGYSAPVELIEKSNGGCLTDVAGWVNEKTSDRNFAVANEENALNFLLELYNNTEYRMNLGRNAYQWAKQQTWLESAKKFDKIIVETIQQPRIKIFPSVFGFEVLDKDVI